MIAALRTLTNHLLGRGDAAITVPPFDGALKPNQRLEEAEVVATSATMEDLAVGGGVLLVADGDRVLRLDSGALHEVRRFERPLTAICACVDGALAVAVDGREIHLIDPATGEDRRAPLVPEGLRAVNALAQGPAGTLLATEGSTEQSVGDWAHDLMNRGRTGRLVAIDLPTRSVRVIADGLRYAFGVAADGADVLVSESWRHRLIAVADGGAVRPVLDHLPVYPSRLSRAADGGFWLTAFTARTQLVEFVLREAGYRRRMMQELDPQDWIVPRLRSGHSFREPMQGAHLKTMGVVKPWAPPRSYGLVIRLNAQGVPQMSLHSRVDGSNHGVVAAVEAGDALYVLAKGPGRLLRLPLATLQRECGA
ncbi:SMP-30/gluconolactonase/LRE family protein [Bradyrhizobium sp. 2TAF24]|uniref:SMP-30/gluconolactonase/LRE family protein n=1 Tax=Bradyrhizobium sp. 2TAF24 TaxID=3233011 RepID=UPI003F921FDC